MIRPLLLPTDPPAVEIVNAQGDSRVLLICDHASNRMPGQLANLGLKSADLAGHISWDPGAAEVARGVSKLLDAPLLLSGYSRLVIDCNRPLSNSESIAEMSDGVRIPGNAGLTPDQKRVRIDELFNPYHQAIAKMLDQRTTGQCILLSIHSFTPVLNQFHRPWQISISYGKDRRLGELLLKSFARYKGLVVGENEPYPIEDDIDYTLPHHGEDRGILHAMIEIRQDLISTKAGVDDWAARLAEVYRYIEASNEHQ